jgi:hypothetical protein
MHTLMHRVMAARHGILGERRERRRHDPAG